MEAYNALIGKKIVLEDGDIITFIKKLPKLNVYKELFKKLPGYEAGIDVKAVSEAINKNIVDVVAGSKVQIRNETQRHQHIGIKDFDQREVYLFDGNQSYRLELCIANLTDGTKIAYVKRYVEKASQEIDNKIKKAETAGQTRLNQPYSNSISQKSDLSTDSLKKISGNDGKASQELDIEYFDAVNRGDTEAEQRMDYVYQGSERWCEQSKRSCDIYDEPGLQVQENLCCGFDIYFHYTHSVGFYFYSHKNFPC